MGPLIKLSCAAVVGAFTIGLAAPAAARIPEGNYECTPEGGPGWNNAEILALIPWKHDGKVYIKFQGWQHLHDTDTTWDDNDYEWIFGALLYHMSDHGRGVHLQASDRPDANGKVSKTYSFSCVPYTGG